MKIQTAEELCYNSKYNDSGVIHYKDAAKLCVQFAKMHVKAALEAAAKSRCIRMFDQTWHAQSLAPSTKILDRVDITVDKQSILNAYPDEKIQ
jgi:hypothetical protein